MTGVQTCALPISLILDVGCGAGRDAKFFLDCGLQVIGIDLSEKLIEIAKKNISNARFYVMDFERLVFPKEKFDGVWASASLVHLPKERLQHVIGEIHQILRKDGLFFSSFRVGAGERFTEERRGKAILKRFYSYYKPEEVRQALMKAEFTIQDEEPDSINSGDWIFFLARK